MAAFIATIVIEHDDQTLETLEEKYSDVVKLNKKRRTVLGRMFDGVRTYGPLIMKAARGLVGLLTIFI